MSSTNGAFGGRWSAGLACAGRRAAGGRTVRPAPVAAIRLPADPAAGPRDAAPPAGTRPLTAAPPVRPRDRAAAVAPARPGTRVGRPFPANGSLTAADRTRPPPCGARSAV